MLESIIEYLSPLTCQIDEYYICIKQGGKYPEENRKIIEDKFDFFEIESTDFDFLDETQKRYIKKLEERINTLLNNDTAIDKITMYSFSFIDMYANYYEVKKDVYDKLAYYKTRLGELISKHTLNQSVSIDERQVEIKYIFKTSFVKELARFEFEGTELFDDDNSDILFKNINLLISNRSADISPELNLKAKYDYIAYYILNEILQFIKSDFELDPKVKINGKPYCTQTRSEAITKNFNKKNLRGKKHKLIESLTKSVDNLINDNKIPG